jgi:hypothetical protein
LDAIFNLLRIIAIAFLAFLGGAFVVLTKVFPYNYVNNAHEAIIAVYKQQTEYESPYRTNLWRKARTEERGVTIHKPGQTYSGRSRRAALHFSRSAAGTAARLYPGWPYRNLS